MGCVTGVLSFQHGAYTHFVEGSMYAAFLLYFRESIRDLSVDLRV